MNTVSPSVITLPWRADAADYYFSPLNTRAWAMMLHSGHARHPHNRFDIVVADPVTTLITRGDTTQMTTVTGSRRSDSDPLSLLHDALEKLNIHPVADSDLPFQGGALGLLGYDLGRRFATLPTIAAADITLPDMAMGIYDWALIVDHQRQVVSLLSHRDVEARRQWLLNQQAAPRTPFSLTSRWRANMTRAGYGEKFRAIQNGLRNGDCYQVNLAQRFSATYQGSEWQAFTHINPISRAPFSAFLRLEDGAVLSFSPERFIRLERHTIQTRPIKGTLPRLSDPAQDQEQIRRLAASEKDRAENLMIVDLMRNDIGRVAIPGSVRVPELFVVESFPTVHHLVSTVTAQLPRRLDGCDVLRAVFPGGSITGAPKVRAMSIIDKLEGHRRNAWCGSIGYLSFCGGMDSNITIRTLTAFNGQLYASAGGGIVADSTEEAEYQETLAKINHILRQLER